MPNKKYSTSIKKKKLFLLTETYYPETSIIELSFRESYIASWRIYPLSNHESWAEKVEEKLDNILKEKTQGHTIDETYYYFLSSRVQRFFLVFLIFKTRRKITTQF